MSEPESLAPEVGEKDEVALIRGWTQAASSALPLSWPRKVVQFWEMPVGMRVVLA
jgi:hypothetical protein